MPAHSRDQRTRRRLAALLFFSISTMVQRVRFFVLLLALLALAVPVGAAPSVPEDEPVPPHSDDEVNEAKEEFESIDSNKDGFITREEILEMDEVPEREEIDEFFSTYDTDNDGRVTFKEILDADDAVRRRCRLRFFFFLHSSCSRLMCARASAAAQGRRRW